MDKTKSEHLTLSLLQRDIFNSFPDLDEVSDNTTWGALRNQVYFCFRIARWDWIENSYYR